jgi:hypothetical protein
LGIGNRIVEALSYRFETPEVMVAAEQTVKPRQLVGLHQPGLEPVQQGLFVRGR